VSREAESPTLSIRNLSAGYGASTVLRRITFDVERGSVVAVLGPNGAGKSTLLNTIMGLVRARQGSIAINGVDVTRARPEHVARAGVGYLPQGRRLFPYLSAANNVRIGAYSRRDRPTARAEVESFIKRWPVIERRRDHAAGLLSGGEQQIVGLGRALMVSPQLLLLDEPSLGLAPVLIKETYRQVRSIVEERRLTVVLVEQNISQALALADHVHVLVSGEIVMSAQSEATGPDEIARLYFAGASGRQGNGGDR
jgi:branched-chain amino acid transport system ATP-binding protein